MRAHSETGKGWILGHLGVQKCQLVFEHEAFEIQDHGELLRKRPERAARGVAGASPAPRSDGIRKKRPRFSLSSVRRTPFRFFHVVNEEKRWDGRLHLNINYLDVDGAFIPD